MRIRTVAVIDDDKKFLSEIEGLLPRGDYVPVVVNDALLAVDTVVRSESDVILPESGMPRKNGFELIVAINKVFETSKIPLIAMSNFYKKGGGRLFDVCGIKKWLKKPFQPIVMNWAVENEREEVTYWDRENYVMGMERLTCVKTFRPLMFPLRRRVGDYQYDKGGIDVALGS